MGVFLLDGIQAYYKMDETSGDRADSTIYANDAGPEGVPVDSEATVVKLGRSVRLNFGGGTGLLSIPATEDLQFGDESMTISVHARLIDEALGSGALVARWVGTTERSYALFYSQTPNAYVFAVSDDGSNTNSVSVTSSIAPVSFSQWYHIVAIHDADADELQIYVTPDTEDTPNSPDTQAHALGIWDENPNDILIGRLATAGFIKGYIDELGIWRRALNAEEIQALFDVTPFSQFVSSDSPSLSPLILAAMRRGGR